VFLLFPAVGQEMIMIILISQYHNSWHTILIMCKVLFLIIYNFSSLIYMWGKWDWDVNLPHLTSDRAKIWTLVNLALRSVLLIIGASLVCEWINKYFDSWRILRIQLLPPELYFCGSGELVMNWGCLNSTNTHWAPALYKEYVSRQARFLHSRRICSRREFGSKQIEKVILECYEENQLV
jgi:hypothetical protein